MSETELDIILAGEEPKQARCVTAKPSPVQPSPIVELTPVEQSTPTTTRATSADQVFKLIRGGVRTWDALMKQTRLTDEELGLALVIYSTRGAYALTTSQERECTRLGKIK